MPKLIKDGAVIEETAVNPALTLEQWVSSDDRATRAVVLEPGDHLAPLLDHLDTIPRVEVNFASFMDGRGFSYGRELRERGYEGELRAVGSFIRDQLTYLGRCGFNAFQMQDETQLESAMASLADFTDGYQASVDRPMPLFRRR